MEEYRTLLEIVQDLLEKGYTADFNLAENLHVLKNHYWSNLPPEDFEIDEIHIAEDETSPGKLLLVFAISSVKYQLRGIVFNALSSENSPSFKQIVKRIRHFILK